MNEIKVKVEVEKKIAIPELAKIDKVPDRCILNDKVVDHNCNGIVCSECICNIDNLMMMANSHNLQLL